MVRTDKNKGLNLQLVSLYLIYPYYFQRNLVFKITFSLHQSFNLKPAVATRPRIQGPKTNMKLAAILEKANSIRQVSPFSVTLF